jgi:3-oxoacyl-[acyl-carrier protein] reductase
MSRSTLARIAGQGLARLGRAERTLRRRTTEALARSGLLGLGVEAALDPVRAGIVPKAPLRIELGGKVALVTGASGELGRVIARTLAACGADVALHYFTGEERAQALERTILELGVRCVTVQADVTSAESVGAMRRDVARSLGVVDVLVLNAVAQYHWQRVLEQPIADFQDQFSSSVAHSVLLAQAFVPAMIERGSGRVIGINTECAMQAFAHQGAYVAGKRGMDGVLRVLAREVGRHQITVNQVAPGWMVSDKVRAAGTERQPDYERTVPLGRRGYDQDVANAVAFLASDLAAFVTGVYLPVCGGNVMPAI